MITFWTYCWGLGLAASALSFGAIAVTIAWRGVGELRTMMRALSEEQDA